MDTEHEDDGGCPVLCHFAHRWLDFRVAELRAVAEATGVRLSIDEADVAAVQQAVFLPLRVPDEPSVHRLAGRAVLVKRFGSAEEQPAAKQSAGGDYTKMRASADSGCVGPVVQPCTQI